MTLNLGGTRDNPDFKFVELRKSQVCHTIDSDVTCGIAFSETYRLLFSISSESRVEIIQEETLFNYDWSKSVINQSVPVTPLTAFNTAFKPSFLSVSLGSGRVLACCGVGQQEIWH